MSYESVIEGLDERFATVPGIAAILDYEPRSVHATPLLYSLLDRAEAIHAGQVRGWRYRILHRLIVPWQESEGAELQIIPFVSSIPAAVEADPHLGDHLPNGYAEISEIDAGWVTIANTEYRCLDFYSTVIEK